MTEELVRPDNEKELAALFGKELVSGAEAGLLDDDRDELVPPRILICQDKSGVVTEGLAEPGDIYSQIHEESLRVPVRLTPILITREWVKWAGPPPSPIEWRTSDPTDPRVEGDPESFKLKYHHWLVVLWGDGVGGSRRDFDPQPCVLTFKRSSMPAGRQFYSTIKAGKFPPFCQVYRLSSKEDRKRPSNWLPVLAFDGYLTPDKAKITKAFLEQFRPIADSIKVDMEADQSDVDSDDTPF